MRLKKLKKSKAFTLLEVLVAVVIVAIALVALLSTSSQTIRGHQHLLDKTWAIWIGDNQLHEISQGKRFEPYGESRMANQTFTWQIDSAQSQSALNQVDILIYRQDTQIGHLQSYVFGQAEP